MDKQEWTLEEQKAAAAELLVFGVSAGVFSEGTKPDHLVGEMHRWGIRWLVSLQCELTSAQAQLASKTDGFESIAGALAAKQAQLEAVQAQLAEAQKGELEAISERDYFEECLTELAEAVGHHFEVPVGEWSNVNDPGQSALEILSGGYRTKYDILKDDLATAESRIAALTSYKGERPELHVAGWMNVEHYLREDVDPILDRAEATIADRDATIAELKAEIAGGVGLIAAERKRHSEVEGWTSAHDDDRDLCELARAATRYTGHVINSELAKTPMRRAIEKFNMPNGWFKPSPDPIRNLVKAGALIAAEIDRLKRKSELDALKAGKDVQG